MDMKPNELHELLQTLKGKNSFDVNITETKKTVRNELVAYRSDQPNPPLNTMVPYPKDRKDIVFYSFLNNPSKPAIAEHEYKRLKLSWESLRKHNSDIEVRFCLSGCTEHEYNIWQVLCEDNDIMMYPFHESFSADLPNAWCIHRWYNLALWHEEKLNVLYLDADTYINGDIQMVFDIYRRDPI